MRIVVSLLCVLALAAPGCGGDDEPPPKPAPELTLPESQPKTTDTTDTTDTTGTTTDTTPPQTGTGTTPDASGGESGGTPSQGSPQQDSPQNDTPPPRGSPEERFENFCEANPGACG